MNGPYRETCSECLRRQVEDARKTNGRPSPVTRVVVASILFIVWLAVRSWLAGNQSGFTEGLHEGYRGCQEVQRKYAPKTEPRVTEAIGGLRAEGSALHDSIMQLEKALERKGCIRPLARRSKN